MNRSQIFFFCATLLIVVAIYQCGPAPKPTPNLVGVSPSPPLTAVASPSPPPAAAPSATPKSTPVAQASPSPAPAGEFHKVAEQVSPSVILISFFDTSGKLLRNGTGFFVSDDGKIVTSRSFVEGAANAVVKTADGKIFNVTGILADVGALDMAVLKAQPKQAVSFLALNKAVVANQGGRIAMIGSPTTQKDTVICEGTIAAKHSEQSGETLDFSKPIPNESIGSPAVNERGEVIGVVTRGATVSAANIIRAIGTVDVLLGQVKPAAKTRWLVAEAPPAPGEGPSPKPKIPLAGGRPGSSRLVYSPAPGYPTAARHSYMPIKGTGRYRVSFGANGEVKSVAVLQSTRSDTLDNAALDTLRRWKAVPGPEWTASVPITFQP